MNSSFSFSSQGILHFANVRNCNQGTDTSCVTRSGVGGGGGGGTDTEAAQDGYSGQEWKKIIRVTFLAFLLLCLAGRQEENGGRVSWRIVESQGITATLTTR